MSSLFYLLGNLAILWIKFLYPVLIRLIQKLDYAVGKKVMVFLIVFLAFDLLLTLSAVIRAREKEKGVPPANFYEELLDKTFNQKYFKNIYNNSWGDK